MEETDPTEDGSSVGTSERCSRQKLMLAYLMKSSVHGGVVMTTSTVRASTLKGLGFLDWKGSQMVSDMETPKVKFDSRTPVYSKVRHSNIMQMLRKPEINLEGKGTIGVVSGPG
ncbi:UNVERIFIED_CONTAM: hypothetical protein K2H54_071960 [Gekko kuhli]